MSIKWYRSSGKRVLAPKRDKPKSPKNIPIKKPKKLGLPKFPKIKKPRVHLPFVVAENRTSFNSNLSAAGLTAVMEIAKEKHLEAGLTKWIVVHENAGTCPNSKVSADTPSDEVGTKVCTYLASKTWGTLSQFMDYIKDKSKNNGTTPADGIWGASHVNCRCYITVQLNDPAVKGRNAVYEIYTDPALGAGRGGPTVSAGYALAGGNITAEELDKVVSPTKITDLTKFNDKNKEVRKEYRNRYDIFDHEVKPESSEWYEKQPGYVLPPAQPAAPPPTVEAPAVIEEPRTTGVVVPEETEEQKVERLKKEKDAELKAAPKVPGLP